MKVLARLAILILLTPAILLAQAPSSQKPAESPANDAKQAGTQTAVPSAAAAPSASSQSGEKSADTATEKTRSRPPAQYAVMSTSAKERARQIYGYFAHDQFSELYSSFSPQMKKDQPEAKLVTISKQMSSKLGSPGQVIAENFTPDLMRPVTIYLRVTKYSKSKDPVVVLLGVNEQGQMERMQILPAPDLPKDQYTDYQDTAKLHLPFEGSWIVAQGGRTLYDNAFAGTDDNRYVVLFVLTKDGGAFANDGKKNEDYYCFGQPVLAPAAGTVMQTVRNVPDHSPGKGAEFVSNGNYVVIAHGGSEYSLLPYLKQGSVRVHIGQRVKEGEQVGECGDSGSSLAPHIEYKLQNTRGFPLPNSLPAQFVDYVADGKDVAIGEPLRGQVVANQQKTTPVTETAAKPQ